MILLKEKIKNFFVHILLIILLISFVLLIAFPLRYSVLRFASSIKDLGLSCAYSFCLLFNIKTTISASVLTLPNYEKILNSAVNPSLGILAPITPSVPDSVTPQKFDNFFTKYFNLYFDINNLTAYFFDSLAVLLIVVQIILIVFIPIYILNSLGLFKDRKIRIIQKDSIFLKLYKLFERSIISFFVNLIFRIKNTLSQNKIYRILFIFLFLFGFNILTIFIEFFAYYIYLIANFDIASTFYYQLYKFYVDFHFYLVKVPLILHIFLIYVIFDKLRRKQGYFVLRLKERANKRIIDSMSICSFAIGTMGSNKTTTITDITISKSEIFRNKALEFILGIKKKYPTFNFTLLDKLIINAIETDVVFNFNTSKTFLESLFEENQEYYDHEVLFGFDLNVEFDNGLNITTLKNDLFDYIKLMLIYISNSSLIYSNYSIRLDNSYFSLGNFPIHHYEYFEIPSYKKNEFDQFSNVLNFDMMRLGKKIKQNNQSYFDFGIITITEIGKERGNQLTTQGLKKNDSFTNQKNDLFNDFIKLIRHQSTICNYPFCFVICDDQRADSLNADLRELNYLYKMNSTKKEKLAIPFYKLEALLSEEILNHFDNYYLDRIYRRADNTLLNYLFLKFSAWIYKRNSQIKNIFGYIETGFVAEEDSKNGKQILYKYNLLKKKIYSSRFSTDAYSKYFDNKKMQAVVGIQQEKKYKNLKATFEELNMQNSYLITDLETFGEIE